MPPRRINGSTGINGDDVRVYQGKRVFSCENLPGKSACGIGGNEISSTTLKQVCPEDCNDRVLMRQWLEDLANAGTLAGLQWLDQQNRLVKINWKHASKSGWSKDDSEVFVKWAQYTGKYDNHKGQFKRWKANFRCALRSLPDVEEVKDYKDGNPSPESFKVFRLLEEVPRKRSKRSSESSTRTLSSSSSTSRSKHHSTDSSQSSSSSSPRVIVLPASCTPLLSDFHTGHWVNNAADPMQHVAIDCVAMQYSNVPIPTFVENLSVNEFSDVENQSEDIDSSETDLQLDHNAVFQSLAAFEEVGQQLNENFDYQTASNTLASLLPLYVAYGSELE